MGKVDLNADDMVRTAAVSAVEVVRDDLVPREMEQAYLRGVLRTEADAAPFLDARNAGNVDPTAVIEMLVSSGLLKRNRTNRRLQFSYDPVAEYPAAWRVSTSREDSEMKAGGGGVRNRRRARLP